MKSIEAHEVIAADKGVEIVVTSAAGITYVGWLLSARDLRSGFTGVQIDDACGVQVTCVLRDWQMIAITPFPTMAVGDRVTRAGFDDPEHKNFRVGGVGRVLQVARDTNQNQVYKVTWPLVPEPRWHTRRMLRLAEEGER